MACIVLLRSSYHDETYRAILMTRTELEKSINMIAPLEMKNPGKIYFKDDYIFISEKYKGIHIINNKDPLNPVKTGFITAPGCIDMAIKQDILYLDNAVDLVAVRLKSNNQSIEVKKRIKNVFPEITPPDGNYIPNRYMEYNRPENTVIVEWIKK
jgi:hypothetical protein